MSTIYKTKTRCQVCNQYIKVTMHNCTHDYLKCDNCNLIYVRDHKTKKLIKAYEPRKTIEF